jgi:hypothetical protein
MMESINPTIAQALLLEKSRPEIARMSGTGTNQLADQKIKPRKAPVAIG